jgi:hypothetical protein
MYQLYFKCDYFKTTAEFETIDQLNDQLKELMAFFDGCSWFYAEIIGPDGTQIQRVTKNG